MATKTRHALAVRRGPVVSKRTLEKVKAASLARLKRGREVAAKRTGTVVGTLAGGLAGYLERTGKITPKYSSPVAFGVAGISLAFVAPETSLGRGKLGAALAEAGSGLLAVAAYKLGLGQAMVGEDDSVEGEWGAD